MRMMKMIKKYEEMVEYVNGLTDEEIDKLIEQDKCPVQHIQKICKHQNLL